MPKLIDDTPARGGPPIGTAGILSFIDELNAARAVRGIRQRYRPVEVDGVVTMGDDYVRLPADAHMPSPTYSSPRLVSSRP